MSMDIRRLALPPPGRKSAKPPPPRMGAGAWILRKVCALLLRQGLDRPVQNLRNHVDGHSAAPLCPRTAMCRPGPDAKIGPRPPCSKFARP
eukprot:11273245-Heterocapsa_arctica.AAC.1